MAAKYWLKLYYEMLDDAKVGRLRPALRWRFIETLLVAGECDEDGFLPSIDHYAWRVRSDAESVETDFVSLADAGLLSQVDGRWYVTKFKERQAPVSGAERVARFRERQKKQEYYDKETLKERDGNEPVTNRYTDTDKDTDKIREDEDYEPTIGGNHRNQQIDPLIQPAITQLVEWWLNLVGGSLPASTDMRRSKLYDPAKQLLTHLDSDFPRAKDLLKYKREEMLKEGKTPKWLEAMVPYIVAEFDKPKPGEVPEDWGSNAIRFEQ